MKVFTSFRHFFLRILGIEKSMEERISYLRSQGMIIGSNCYIGENCKFGRGGKDPIIIGDNCVLTGCTILGHDASPALFVDELFSENLKKRLSLKLETKIGDRVFIGVNSTILTGITIGNNTIVGAGSVVTKDVPPNSVVAGNPAKVISSIEKFKEKYSKLYKEHPEYFYFGKKN